MTEQEIQKLIADHTALRNDYTTLSTDYTELSAKYATMKEEFALMQQQMDWLRKQLQALSSREELFKWPVLPVLGCLPSSRSLSRGFPARSPLALMVQ